MALDPTAVVIALANVSLAVFTLLYIRELRNGYARSIEPHLVWENPRRVANPPHGAVFTIVMRNVGPGYARLVQAIVGSSAGPALSIRDLRWPSTLARDVQYTFFIDYPAFGAALMNNAQIAVTIIFKYTDMESRSCYRSEIVLNAGQKLGGATEGPIDFVTADERPARARRVLCRPSRRDRLWNWIRRKPRPAAWV